MGPYWTIHWGSGIIKRLRTPVLDREVVVVLHRPVGGIVTLGGGLRGASSLAVYLSISLFGLYCISVYDAGGEGVIFVPLSVGEF